MPAPRVVSLLPSCTELVYALGMGECLVGRSHECDYPPEVRKLPVLTRSRVDSGAGSAAIDAGVKALLRDGLSLYEIDLEALRRAKPHVVLTQAQCDVCAVTVSDVEAALESWTGRRPRVVSTAPRQLADVWGDIAAVAEALGAAQRGRDLVKTLKTRVVDVVEKTCVLKRRPSVACVEWLEPLMAAGNWVPELVELAGGVPVFGEPGKHSPWLEWQSLAEADPDVIVVMPCGFDLKRVGKELPLLTGHPGWDRLSAVRRNRVFLVDGSQYFNRPGPRMVDSLQMLVEMLHPGLLEFGHEGTGWRRV